MALHLCIYTFLRVSSLAHSYYEITNAIANDRTTPKERGLVNQECKQAMAFISSFVELILNDYIPTCEGSPSLEVAVIEVEGYPHEASHPRSITNDSGDSHNWMPAQQVIEELERQMEWPARGWSHRPTSTTQHTNRQATLHSTH